MSRGTQETRGTREAPKPSWLVPWEDLDEGQREVDMRIGVTLFHLGRAVVTPEGVAVGAVMFREFATRCEVCADTVLLHDEWGRSRRRTFLDGVDLARDCASDCQATINDPQQSMIVVRSQR